MKARDVSVLGHRIVFFVSCTWGGPLRLGTDRIKSSSTSINQRTSRVIREFPWFHSSRPLNNSQTITKNRVWNSNPFKGVVLMAAKKNRIKSRKYMKVSCNLHKLSKQIEFHFVCFRLLPSSIERQLCIVESTSQYNQVTSIISRKDGLNWIKSS